MEYREKWLESVYSDGTKYFVDNPLPKKGEIIKISIRMYEDAPVKAVYFRTKINGAEHVRRMEYDYSKNGLAYFCTSMAVHEKQMHYQFYILTEKCIYYYTQYGITTYIQDEAHDFRILTDYRQPEWVKESVFYQIFPERFYNGDNENDVRDSEYMFDGHPTIKVKKWNEEPRQYNESFCLDFYGGDLSGIIKKLSYLKALGATALYLNPVFYAATVHKYDCMDYFNVDPHFGGNESLEALVKACHDNNMKIILDISVNHTGTSHRWFNKEGNFFDKSIGAYNNKNAKEREYYFFDENNDYRKWAGVDTLPSLNYSSENLRDIIYKKQDSVIKKWLKPPYNIDGWRFDVADVMARYDELQLHHDVWPQIHESIKEENPSAYILAEDWSDCSEFLNGDEWDSPMNYYGCARPLRQFAGEEDLFNARIPGLSDCSYKMTAKDLHERIKSFISKLPTVIQQNLFNLIDSHDITRLHNNPKVNFGDYKGVVMLQFGLIGTPCIYYGDEADIKGRITDVEGARYPMPWDSNFEASEIFNLYRALAHLKQCSEALKNGGMKVLSDAYYVFSFARFTLEEAVIFAASADDMEREINIPFAALGINSVSVKEDIFGSKLEYRIEGRSMKFKVKPHTGYVFII